MVCLTLGRTFAGGAEIVFDFESGSLAGSNWIVAEGCNDQPVGCRETLFYKSEIYPKQGKYYLTTLESSENDWTNEPNESVLESPVFVPTEGRFQFLLGGGNRAEVCLSLCTVCADGAITEVEQYRGKNTQDMEKRDIDLTPYIGQRLLFRLIDRGRAAWGYLHADDFRGQGFVDEGATETRREFLKKTKLLAVLDAITQRIDRLATIENAEENGVDTQFTAKVNSIHESTRLLKKQDLSSEELKDAVQSLSREMFALEHDILRTSARFGGSTILYVSRPQFPYEHHNTETTYQTDDICTHMMPVTGSALKLWRPATDEVHVLLNVPEGIVRDPCVHFDGQRILVSLRWNLQDDFHIYEMDLRGRDPWTTTVNRDDLRQLTYGSGLSDIDPQYLPNGRIVFSSSREPKYCMCNRHIMMNLHTMEADGSNILQIGHSTLYEGHSSLLPDGRILYYRWEYVDRNFSDAEGAWTVNPDGTNHALFWGNNTESPATTIDPRIMPGSSSEYVCTMTACHISPWGAIGVIDRRKGLDGKAPVVQVWPQEAWDLIGTYTGQSYDNLMHLQQFFEDPWPLDDDNILAAGTIPPNEMYISAEEQGTGVTGLWLLTFDGGIHLLHTDPVGCFDPMPLAASEAPPEITDRVDLTKETGSFYVTDVNEGFGMSEVPRGMAKYLRIIEAPEKRFWTYPSWVGVDGKGNQQAPGMNWDEFGNKRILGIVPIEEDGSVYFTLPADRFVFFQLLDENKEMIQSMRSGVIVRPGETNGCYGCHEDRLETPVSSRVTQAMQKAPQEMRLEFDREPFLFSYTAEVQPILDQYCVACHDFPTESSSPLARQAAEKLVLCGDLNPAFNKSYWELRDKKLVNAIGSAYAEKLKPLVWGSRHSKLMDVMKHGHDQGGPIDQQRQKLGLGQVDARSISMVACWIDLNAPYYPDFSSGFPNNPYGRSPLTFEETARLAELTGYVAITIQMAGGGRPERPLEPAISFTRPEISPCLNQWNTPELRENAEYQESLALIKLGADRLRAAPREDMPGWKLTNPIEIRRNEKYEVFRERLKRMQEAAATGQTLLDKDNQLPFDICIQ
ncbi:MAG: hypothetical protein Q4G68_05080 [Planctomycetia bacterium]|nr:hypothetical protein [Planctomycetia bacterium]